jgi:hypothetical protein
MALFKKRSPMEKLQKFLPEQRARAAALSVKRTAAEAALADATAAREKHMLSGDLADDQTAEKLQGMVDSCTSRLAGLDAALAALQMQIADTERALADERGRIERSKAGEKLERDLDEIERALPDYLKAAGRLADALEVVHFHFEVTEMATFVRSGQAQVEIAAAVALQELRATAALIKTGAAPIPAPKPSVEPVAVIEPAPETRRMFAMRAVKWKDAEGRQCFGQQFEDVDLTPAAASRGLRCAAVVLINDERRQRLHGARGGRHVNQNALDLIDLDCEQATRPAHIDPIMASSDPVLRAANFREVDRSAESRVLKISVPRL